MPDILSEVFITGPFMMAPGQKSMSICYIWDTSPQKRLQKQSLMHLTCGVIS